MHLRPSEAARKAIAGPRAVPFRQDLSRRSLVCKALPRHTLAGTGTGRAAPPSIYRNLRHGGLRSLAGSSVAFALLATLPAPLAGQATELQLTPDRLTLEAGRRQAL